MGVETMTNGNNVRFWVWHNGVGESEGSWVKITIPEGESRCIASGGPHDEGYSWTWERYRNDGDALRLESDTESRDCDGPHHHSIDLECLILDGQLDTETHPNPDYAAPNGQRLRWERTDERQRDYFAEAAGY